MYICRGREKDEPVQKVRVNCKLSVCISICCVLVFNLSLSIICVCPIHSSLQPMQITTWLNSYFNH